MIEAAKKAYFIDSEDCMGGRETYWRAERICSDGRLVMGCGANEKQANDEVDRIRNEHEAFISKSPINQLRIIASNKQICGRDQETAIKLIVKILDEWASLEGK